MHDIRSFSSRTIWIIYCISCFSWNIYPTIAYRSYSNIVVNVNYLFVRMCYSYKQVILPLTKIVVFGIKYDEFLCSCAVGICQNKIKEERQRDILDLYSFCIRAWRVDQWIPYVCMIIGVRKFFTTLGYVILNNLIKG